MCVRERIALLMICKAVKQFMNWGKPLYDILARSEGFVYPEWVKIRPPVGEVSESSSQSVGVT